MHVFVGLRERERESKIKESLTATQINVLTNKNKKETSQIVAGIL